MFECDDYDEILSQIDIPEVNEVSSNNSSSLKSHEKVDTSNKNTTTINISSVSRHEMCTNNNEVSNKNTTTNKVVITNNIGGKENTMSPKHTKRKIINSHFDTNRSKRKFPGPAGLLSGSYEAKLDKEAICEMEFLTQDIDYTTNYLNDEILELPLWKRLLEDMKGVVINSIKEIKHQALVGNLQKKKAQVVAAFVESVDRSAIDPLITLRDNTGSIKCTLHRDAWNAFSAYIVSEHCAIVLLRPTVLTTGSAFKKHYLNITLSNISSIYASAVINDSSLPEGFNKSCEEEYSIIKKDAMENSPENEMLDEDIDFLQDLENAFSDDMF